MTTWDITIEAPAPNGLASPESQARLSAELAGTVNVNGPRLRVSLLAEADEPAAAKAAAAGRLARAAHAMQISVTEATFTAGQPDEDAAAGLRARLQENRATLTGKATA